MKLFYLLTIFALSISSAIAQTNLTQTLRAQILLDRNHFSVGEIDGISGSNTKRAIKAFQEANQLSPSGQIDAGTLKALGDDGSNLLATYTVTEEDVNQPLSHSIPRTLLEMSKLDALNYTSLEEAVSEKLQISPKLLKKLNPGKKIAEGTVLITPAVGEKINTKAAKIVITKTESSVRLYDSENRLIAFYPVSLGTPQNPPPSNGQYSVTVVIKNPDFSYSPDRYHSPGTPTSVLVKPGPNNPVGKIWIDLSAEHYGIHGSPDPQNISKTASHGCFRLTNWDASEVADLVKQGTPVVIQK